MSRTNHSCEDATVHADRKGQEKVSVSWFALTGVTISILAGTFLLSHSSLSGPPCPFKTILHLPCPGCGMTRSLSVLWHGDLYLSFRYHPLGLPLFAGCLLLLVGLIFNRKPIEAAVRRLIVNRRVMTRTAILILGIWLVRIGFLCCGSEFFLWR
jgi:hypothetical protein